MKAVVLKFFYAALFVAFVPLAIAWWITATTNDVNLPVYGSQNLGYAFCVLGILLLMESMREIIVYGKGLPMNITPPQHFVSKGIYALLPHPIYFGFCIAVYGYSMAVQSPSGLWLVSPLVALCCAALVWGYERSAIHKHFGTAVSRTLLSIPENSQQPTITREKISAYSLVLIPWVVIYEIVLQIGVPASSIQTMTVWDAQLPIIEWSELFYSATYLVVAISPILIRTKWVMRRFMVAGLVSTVLVHLLYCCFPTHAVPREFSVQSLMGMLIMFERSVDYPGSALPSFHVIWIFLSADALSADYKKYRMPLFALAALVSVSCITVGIHSIADVVAGLLFFVFVRDIEKRWYAWVSVADRFANYWRNWRMGPVRIINHGFYVGLAAVCGVVMVELQLAPSYTIPVIIIGLSIIAGAGIWAQFLEGGKDGFSRPFGFYGGIFGAVLGGVVCSTMGYNLVLLLSSFCVAAPLIQALGRLRCLVQGCCHGAMCTTENGLHYHTPLSRPVKAGLQGRPLYPTQLYSIIANVITLGILIRLRLDHSAPEMIIGVYLLLNGVARFIEEHYRGEPQTKEIMGLRTYQWLSIAFVIAGAIFTTQSTELDYSPISIDVTGLVTALSFGILTAFAMGVDFPDSNKRFSRLA